MKTNSVLMGAALVACCGLTLSTRAGERERKGGMANGGPIQHILEASKELNLTEDQKKKLHAIAKEFTAGHDFESIREKAKDNPELREVMKEMKAARDSGDEAKMKELREKFRSKAGDGEKGRDGAKGGVLAKLKDILTPEQMMKLKEIREKNGEGRGGREGAGRDGDEEKRSKPDASKGVPDPFDK